MNAENRPLVSVIIPVFNAEKFLHQCISSVTRQSLRDIQIILVNDGSSDDSKSICDYFASIDFRICVFHIDNKGVSNARNIGIKNARSEFIMFLDADDWIDLNTCQLAYDFAKEHKLDIVFWSWQKVSIKGIEKETYLEKNSAMLVENNVAKLRIRSIGLQGNELSDPTKTDAFNTPWAKLYSRALIVDSNIFFIERKKVGMEDVLFNIEIFRKANRVSYIPAYLNFYRLDNPDSLSKVDTHSFYAKLKNLASAIENLNLDKEAREALNNRKIVSLINVVLSLTNPRAKSSIIEKWTDMNSVLRETEKRVEWDKFPFQFLPIHWKLFFLLAKWKRTTMLFVMVYVIRLVR